MQTSVTIRGLIAPALLDVLRSRFGDAGVVGTQDTTLVVDGTDQASARALLALLWDAGHEVIALINSVRDPP